jgi:hypothetical protein
MMIDLIGVATQSQVPTPRIEKSSETEEPRPIEAAEETTQSPLDLTQHKSTRQPRVVEWKKEHYTGEARYDARGHLIERPEEEVPSPPAPSPVDITV